MKPWLRMLSMVMAGLVFWGCGGTDEGYIEIVYADDLNYVAVPNGLKTPCKLITYRTNGGENSIACSIPNLYPMFPVSWRQVHDFFLPLWPAGMTPGIYTGVLEITASPGPSPDAWEVKTELPCQVEIVDPSSEPFPGSTQNGGEDIKFFEFFVSSGMPGLTMQTLEIVNQGAGTLTWMLTSDSPWLHVSPYVGDTTTEADVIDVNVNVAGFTAGEVYIGAVTVDSNSLYSPQEKIYVVLVVTE